MAAAKSVSLLPESGSILVKRPAVVDLTRIPEENPNPVMRVSADGALLYANPAGHAILLSLGWDADEQLPATLREPLHSAAGEEFDVEADGRVYSVATSYGAPDRDVNLYFRDVTSRKQTEEALRRMNAELEWLVAEQTAEIRRSYEAVKAERQRLYNVLNTLPAYVVLLGKDYRVPFANRFFEERFGKSEGRRCFEYLFQRAEPCENCETFRVFETHAPHHWEWTGPDGRNYDVHDFPFTDSDGAQLILELGIDVTEIHKARDALNEANRTLEQRVAERTAELARVKEEWELTFNTVPDLIAILDNRHRIVRVNRAMAQALSVAPEECVGLPCYRCMHGTDRPPACCPHVCTLADGSEHSAELHEERLRGDFLVSTTPIYNAAGELTGAVHVARDITERKRAEKVLRESREDLDRAQAVGQIGSWRLDVRRNVLTWSEENHRIFNVPAGTPLAYETFLDKVHPDDRAFVDRQWSAALRGEGNLYDIEHRILVDGRVKWVRERAEIEFDEQGKLLGGFGTTQDVTERKQADQALRELNETLEQRVAERTAVAENRAWELRRMTAELSQAEHRERKRLARVLHDDLQQLLLAARLRLAGIGGDAAESVKTSIDAVDGLLGDCMAVSRDLTMELSPPILHRGTLGDALEWLGGWFGEKHGMEVAVDVQDELPSTEPVRVLFFHAVREMLLNALKHSGAKTAKLAMFGQEDDLAIVVEDGGSDFQPDVVEMKLKESHSFGLPNIKERMEALGGRMEIGRTASGGAHFRLIMPLSKVMEPSDNQRQQVPLPLQPQKHPREKSRLQADTIRLLVVDDHKVVREGFVSLLECETDFEVVGQAADGADAVRQARALQPDAIVMDVEMPILDGIEATRQIKRQWPNILVIGLSLHEEDSVARAIIGAGAAAHLGKNGPADALVKAIRRGCGRT